MADLTQSKQQFASQMIEVATRLLLLAEDLDNLAAAYSVHAFNTGAANAFSDADFTTTNSHLSASIVADVLFALGTVNNAVSTGVRNSLRECLIGGLP